MTEDEHAYPSRPSLPRTPFRTRLQFEQRAAKLVVRASAEQPVDSVRMFEVKWDMHYELCGQPVSVTHAVGRLRTVHIAGP